MTFTSVELCYILLYKNAKVEEIALSYCVEIRERKHKSSILWQRQERTFYVCYDSHICESYCDWCPALTLYTTHCKGWCHRKISSNPGWENLVMTQQGVEKKELNQLKVRLYMFGWNQHFSVCGDALHRTTHTAPDESQFMTFLFLTHVLSRCWPNCWLPLTQSRRPCYMINIRKN